MQIAVAGKGGAGKTIVAGTLARWFGANGDDVVAIDDDDNPNLAVSLGLAHELPARSFGGARSARAARAPLSRLRCLRGRASSARRDRRERLGQASGEARPASRAGLAL